MSLVAAALLGTRVPMHLRCVPEYNQPAAAQGLASSQWARMRHSCHCCSEKNRLQCVSRACRQQVDALEVERTYQSVVLGLAAYTTLGVLPSGAAEVLSAAASASQPVDAAAGAAAAAAIVPVDPSTYVPGPVEVGWQIWFAAIVSTIPFVIGAYEFGKRILIQRRCQVCGGSGLVQKGRFQRKCPECGGFFPWISWQMFLSANARPGNGGPLLQPRGQSSVFYTVPPPPGSNTEAAEQQQQTNNGSSSFQIPMPGQQLGQVQEATAASQVAVRDHATMDTQDGP